MPLNSSLLHVGLAKETIQGTAVVPTVWFPVENNIKDEDVIKWIEDKGLRGAPVDPIAQYQGPISSTVDFDSMFYPESLGHVLMALMGVDTILGAANPYTHTLTLAQDQPPSYTLSVFNGYNERQYPGSMIDELQLKYAIDGALTASTKWMGFPSAVATTSTPAFGGNDPFLGWESTLTIAGAGNTKLIGFDWTGKRKVITQWAANNSQKPSFVYSSALGVTGKLTFAVEDDTELTYMLSNTQPAVTIELQAPNAGPSLTIQMSKCAFAKKTPSYSKEFVEVDYDITALPSSTDAGTGSPISPVKFVLTNAQSTTY